MKTNHELFLEIQEHLMKDENPSIFMEQITQKRWFDAYPMNLIHRLKEMDQSPKYHPEGNVWNHTMLVLNEGAKVKQKSKNPTVFMWALMLHDIGKGETTKHFKGRITAYDHDRIGAMLAKEFLLECTKDIELIEKVVPMVRWHMQLLYVLKNLPFAKIQEMKEEVDLHEISLLGFCDRMGRVGADRKKEEENLRNFIKICEEVSS